MLVLNKLQVDLTSLHTVNRRPIWHWGLLLLCVHQTEQKEDKTRREPRDEEEQLHAEHKEHSPGEIQPVLLVTLKVFAFDYCDC